MHYKATANAWMTRVIFREWFEESFIPQVKKFLKQENLPQKAILLLDNATSHNDEVVSDDGNFLVKWSIPCDHTPTKVPTK